MKKLNINGKDYIKLETLREEIRHLRKDIPLLYGRFSEEEQAMVHLAYNDIIKVLYREELSKAKTPEDVEAIMEMPGDYLVFTSIGMKKDRKYIYFAGFYKKEPTFTESKDDALWFSYESMAENITNTLKEKYGIKAIVMDMSDVAYERNQRLLKAIFSEDKDEQNTQED